MFIWWRPTGGATRLGVWTRPPALYSSWREPGVKCEINCQIVAPGDDRAAYLMRLLRAPHAHQPVEPLHHHDRLLIR